MKAYRDIIYIGAMFVFFGATVAELRERRAYRRLVKEVEIQQVILKDTQKQAWSLVGRARSNLSLMPTNAPIGSIERVLADMNAKGWAITNFYLIPVSGDEAAIINLSWPLGRAEFLGAGSLQILAEELQPKIKKPEL